MVEQEALQVFVVLVTGHNHAQQREREEEPEHLKLGVKRDAGTINWAVKV